jgi:hypothetical protein
VKIVDADSRLLREDDRALDALPLSRGRGCSARGGIRDHRSRKRRASERVREPAAAFRCDAADASAFPAQAAVMRNAAKRGAGF